MKPELLRSIVDSGFEHPSEGKILTFLIVLVLLIQLIVACSDGS